MGQLKFSTPPSSLCYYTTSRRSLFSRPPCLWLRVPRPQDHRMWCIGPVLCWVTVSQASSAHPSPSSLFTGSVTSCEDLMTILTMLSTSSTLHLQTTQPLEECRPVAIALDQSDYRGCSDVLSRPWELEGQGGSCVLNAFISWDVVVDDSISKSLQHESSR